MNAVYILNRVPSKAVAKTPYELWTGKKPSLITCMFRDVQLRQRLTSHMKGNWTQEPLVASLLDMQNALGALSFTIPLPNPFLRLEMQGFLRMLSLGGEIK